MSNTNTSYVSFAGVFDNDPSKTTTTTTTIKGASSSNDIKRVETLKSDLLNIYSSKKYARWFSIGEAKTQSDGNYTVYQVIYRFIPNDLNEKVKELIVWKRFSDFKELYKLLSKYHASLHRRQQFPEFVKTNFFGRFDQKIIEERKECALKLLQFCATQPHLYLNEKFIDFFSAGHIHDHDVLDGQNVLKPVTISPNKNVDNDRHDDQIVNNLKQDDISDNLSEKLEQSIEFDDLNKKKSNDSINIEHLYLELSNLLSLNDTQQQANEFDYIKKSLSYIQDAMFNEKQGYYYATFELYKLAVATMIKGIQKEAQQSRIKLIQEVTQQLLIKAEKIYQKHLNSNEAKQKTSELASSIDNNTINSITTSKSSDNVTDRWTIIDFCQQTYEIETNLSNLHGSLVELNENFLFERVIDKNCFLIKRKQIESECDYYYVLKCLSKSSTSNNLKFKSIVPRATQVRYMCKMHKYYENEYTIFMLIEFKKLNKLYNYFNFKSNDLLVNDIAANSELHLNVDSNRLKMISSFTASMDNYYHDPMLSNTQQQLKPIESLTPIKQLFTLSNTTSSNEISPSNSDSNLNSNLLADKLKNIKKLNFDINLIKTYLAQLLCALDMLHSIGIICKDLNPSNILLNDDQNSICLTYFSRWCLVDEEIDKLAIDYMYTAPEITSIIKKDDIDESCDWWTYGVICYELLTLTKFSDTHSTSNFMNVISYPKNFDEIASSLINQLIQINPKNRFQLEQIKSHAFFSSINWQDIYAVKN